MIEDDNTEKDITKTEESSEETSIEKIGPVVIEDIPEGSKCEVILKYGERRGEECGLLAVASVDGEIMCANHKQHACRPPDWTVRAKQTKVGRLVEFGLVRECKFCFGFKGEMCPHGQEDGICVFETGKHRPIDINITDKTDLESLMEGLLNDDLVRLKRAKLMEHFEGGLLDGAVDNLTKRVKNDAMDLAKVRGIIGQEMGGGSAVNIQQNFVASLPAFEGDEKPPIDGEAEEVDEQKS